MVPPALRALVRRARPRTTCSSCAARACSACRACLAGALARQARGAAARGQRRDVGRGLHLGHALARRPLRGLVVAGDAAVAQPLPARRRRVRGDVARSSATSSWPRRARRSGRAHLPHGVDTRALPARVRRGARRRCAPRLGLPQRRARDHATRAGCCAARASRPWSPPSPSVAAAVPRAHLVLVGSGAGQALSVEDDLRAAVARRGPARRA